VSLIVVENGGSTVRAERVFDGVLKGLKGDPVVAVWRYDFVAVTSVRNGKPETFVRPIRPPGANLLRVAEASVLAERIAKGNVDTAAIAEDVRRIRSIASPYGHGVVVLAAACAAGFFTHFVGGDWAGFGIAFVAGAVGQAIRFTLQAKKFGAASTTLLCGLLSAVIAGSGLRLGIGHVIPATLIGSVGYMIPGLPLVNGFIDVASHRNIFVGMQRILNAAFLFLILAICIAVGEAIAEMK
jgi:uncharacterized membrane protein YjjP (DUF1212 family)